jgi:hypothetical protein
MQGKENLNMSLHIPGRRVPAVVGLVVGLVAALLLLAACGTGLVIGSGNSITEEREIEGVNSVVLAFVGDLRITQGDEEKLVITADNNVMPLITTEVNDGVLTIGSKSTVGLQATTRLEYDLTVRDLNSLRLAGAGNASMDGLETDNLRLAITGAGNLSMQNVDADRVEVALNGLGNLEVSGAAARQEVDLTGAGNYSAADFETGAAVISMAGLGSATLWVVETLDADISGAGNIDYYGDPQVTQKVTGLGRINSKGDK